MAKRKASSLRVMAKRKASPLLWLALAGGAYIALRKGVDWLAEHSI